MDLSTLKSQIKSNKLLPFYIFTGPETEIMRIYMVQMQKSISGDIKNFDSIPNLAQRLNNRSMLGDACICVLRDDKLMLSDESMQAKILQNRAYTHDIIILVYSSIDKRSRLYKNYQDYIVEFEPLKKDILVKYILREVDLSESNCSTLIEACESSYSRILLELDKVRTYMRAKNIDANTAFKYLIDSGGIYVPPYDAVFDFVDAVLRNKPKLSFELLAQSYASGEATMVLLSNLYNSTKQLFQVQTYRGDNLSKATDLTPFQIKLAKGRVGNYSSDELIRIMRLVRGAERGIKVGEIDEMMSIPTILVNIWT